MNHNLYPFRFRRLDNETVVAVSAVGDYMILPRDDLEKLVYNPECLSSKQLAECKAKFFIDGEAQGVLRLLASRIKTKKETVLSGPSLHIIVPTLICEHTCRYCQASRSLTAAGYSLASEDLDKIITTIFESPSRTLTIEFQGGDPLLRFDLVRDAIQQICRKNQKESRQIRFVVASTLHQLNPEMCDFFKSHHVYLSTSIDGPEFLHNKNRPLPSKDSYQRTVNGLRMARSLICPNVVSALLTVTRDSLVIPEAIVDAYVELGFQEVFIRPLSWYGFAKRNQGALTYSMEEFSAFYTRALDRVLYWNKHKVPMREVAASIALNKILSTFDAGYVDLQSPTGAGLAVLVYNYDGYVYPGDEARMLAASGDISLRLGRIGDSLDLLLDSDLQRKLVAASLSQSAIGCRDCAYQAYCGPDPIDSYNRWGTFSALPYWTDHCQRQLWLFDHLFRLLRDSDEWFKEIAERWAQPIQSEAVFA